MINPQVDPVAEPPSAPPALPLTRTSPPVLSRPAANRPPILAVTKTRLTFTPYVPSSSSMQVDEARAFTVLVNPAEVAHSRSISYDEQRGWGSPGSTPRFGSMGNDTMKFALVLDGTGVIPVAAGVSMEVKQQLQRLEGAVYRYDGTDRQPPYVRIVWGSLIFGGRLQSMSTRFTMFTPSGSPLRANVDLTFIGSMDRKEVEAITSAAAGDQSKEVRVREGDTLPELCALIYGDSTRCIEVARLNGLQSLRDVGPGTKLLFPTDFKRK
jgi:phage tail protein X